jgi:diacylglycerol kinase
MKNRPLHHRLGFAFAGLRAAWRHESSFRIELMIALAAVAALVVLRPGLLWAGLIIFAIALVLALELANTAIEAIMDHLHPTIAPEVKFAKDVASAAVLVAGIGAIGVGTLMLIAVHRG